MGLGERLENLLEERELTQRKLAADLHMAPSTLNGYIKGHRQPDHETVIRIAEYFDVSTDYLLGVARGKKRREVLDVREGDLVGIYRKLRQELLASGDLVQDGDGGRLVKTVSFSTPSGAADFVLGGSNNGWIEWKDGDKQTLDALYRK